MRFVANVSWGKDSLAMLLRLLEEKRPLDEVMFYDTTMEFQAIYDTRDKVLPLLAERGIQYTELHPAQPFLWRMMEKPVNGPNGPHKGYSWCGGRCRWGTADKINALDKAGHGGTAYIGIAADETQRLTKKRSRPAQFPLAEWGMTEADCLKYCYERGYEWREDGGAGPMRLYDILDRVSCWCCSNSNLKELKNIYLHQPAYWERLRGIQRHLERPMKGFYRGQPRGVFELEARFRRELEEVAR